MKVRINQIECRFSQGRYEIVKWSPNRYYGKLQEYLEDGYELKDGFVRYNNISILESIFDSPESCYTIATLKYVPDERCCDMHTVGDRLLQLDLDDRNDFFTVYEIAEQRIKQQ